MSYSPNQPRDPNGRFAGGGSVEAAHRDAGRYPTTAHAGTRSVATHTGHTVAVLDPRTQSMRVTHGGRRLATAEAIAKGIRMDGGFARVK